ncbi:hypothetical protein SAMN06265338_101128 [Rhodoblastus acidophilus]|uniref:Porin n=1 Tax=Rhodoblastus acidophilus TaxID=1074 RepID=A0A212PXF6_RHOAC|nr:hypothetical protein [Rhodoblastus acidophilus]MCW2318065.1 hypothetical protein [Rhodoblastus acidophilus]PPQ38774.1 hypothetical protein CKO16_09200 [Rhodoblastus acidophilus]RAI20758.1 hypothetical protein CH337_09005 [Rhodoblastus acidophilus]SNB51737.1 hypothetical protein SAMN06265338_101128 [Rhodoblastus acidophilus]
MPVTKNSRKLARGAAVGATFVLALVAGSGAQAGSAHANHMRSSDRAMQASGEYAAPWPGACIPANGAQILGGFASPDDLLDVNTGAICGKR